MYIDRPIGSCGQPAIRATPACECYQVLAVLIEHGELDIAFEGRGGDRVPIHNATYRVMRAAHLDLYQKSSLQQKASLYQKSWLSISPLQEVGPRNLTPQRCQLDAHQLRPPTDSLRFISNRAESRADAGFDHTDSGERTDIRGCIRRAARFLR
jgi:hypothetical protein